MGCGKRRALLIVDVQNDFCPGGALAVSGGAKVVPVMNKYIRFFAREKLPIFASRDWHPKESRHFRPFGGLWLLHCVRNTKGAKFHPKLKLPKETIIISKGKEPDEDGYSAFQASDNRGNDFPFLLKSYGIEELYIGGIATDYCVKASVLDALKYGFKVKLLTDAIKGVNERDSDRAIRKMVKEGAGRITFSRI